MPFGWILKDYIYTYIYRHVNQNNFRPCSICLTDTDPYQEEVSILYCTVYRAVIHKSSFDMRVYKIQTPFETTSFRKKTPFCLLENIQKWRSTSLLAPSNISQKSIVMYGYILHYLTKPISDTQVKTTYIHYIAVSILLLCIIICEIIWCK